MSYSKTFKTVRSLEEQNEVNDAQKATFRAATALSANLVEERQAAYLLRWRETLVHIGHGATVLDIGCGSPYKQLWDLIVRDHRTAYHVIDIDGAIIGAAKNYMSEYGLPETNAQVGLNTSLPVANAFFDAVVSSHCIEHSSDLAQTFRKISRVLKPGGLFIFAVPFGFDDSDEHLICMDAEGWIASAELAGFKVATVHLGETYVAGGDLFVVAHRRNEAAWPAVQALTQRYMKEGRTFLPATADCVAFNGMTLESGKYRIMATIGSGATVSPGKRVGSVLFLKHRWSGVVEVKLGRQTVICDLYSRIPYIHAMAFDEEVADVEIRVIGTSHEHAQAVLHGVLLAESRQPDTDVSKQDADADMA